MNELEAAIGLGSLEVYDEILKKRKRNFTKMGERFKKFNEYFASIEEEEHEEIGPHAFPIILKEDVKFTRDQFVDFLERNGIDTRSLFSSMPTQCKGFEFLGYRLGEFPEAEYVGNNGIHIGVHQDITDEHIDYFIDVVERFLGDHG
jgi:dTDP-4-amino-4,6-dideoxygalactose transaminase